MSQKDTSGAKAPGHLAGGNAGDKSPAYLKSDGVAGSEAPAYQPAAYLNADAGVQSGAAEESCCGSGCTCGSGNAEPTSQFLTLDAVRAKLKGVKGKRYWRSVDELAGTPEFQAAVEREFPAAAQEWVDPVSRRGFMKLMGASMALAGLAGCTKQPDEPIMGYIKQPEDLILGKPNFFASANPFPTGAVPVLVKSDEYRPIKVDGNPEHPYNVGSSDVFTQGSLLDMYDPDRAGRVTFRGENSSWGEFAGKFRDAVSATKDGSGVYFLSSTVTSPTLARQWQAVQKAYPKAKLVQYDPAIAGTALASGPVPVYSLADADVIVSLDADFLSGAAYPGFHKLVREYAARRKDPNKLNRLYTIESSPTTTGFKAEHRLGLRASEVPAFAAALAAAVGASGISAPNYSWTDEQQKYLQALAKDLKAHAGRSAVIAGLYQDASVAASAAAINQALGNVGKTVANPSQPLNPLPSDQIADLKGLVADLNAGKVQWLVIMNANPVYTAPADLYFADAMERATNVVHLGSHVDETGLVSEWHIPAAHALESWSDARSYDGTVSIVQPMIEPLYGGRSAHDVLQALLDEPMMSAYSAVQETWKPVIKGDFDAGWRKALHDGWIADTAFDTKGGAAPAFKGQVPTPAGKDAFEVIFRPDPNIYDGRLSNVGWLQELPKPVVNLSWDNAAIVSGATLTKLGLEEDDIVEISVANGKVKAPVIVAPGHPDNSVTVYLGYGREVGRVAGGAGFNAYLIRTSDSPFVATGSIKKADGKWGTAITKSHYQDHRGEAAGGEHGGEHAGLNHSLEGNEALERGIIRYATLAEYKQNPGFANEGEGHEKTDTGTTLFPNWVYKDNAWGMSIDMNSCTGCNACIVSCYAENNIAVVGKEQVRIGRNMQWLRIDTYYEGDLAAPKAHYQPMMCQHCENAPCEQVCPVGATVHTPEGLNSMVYNRCVGTRYCSNNCPYKVRRFNFLLYSDFETESLKLMRNPDVSVRSRGVMEKCSYCVQRIQEAKITSDKENRAIKDGEIQTACQQACPAQAITFGNINDKDSRVAKLRNDERTYQVLADLNTRPRTTYVAPVVNPNEELEPAMVEHKG
ncbi:TAT-variant-translocated molybdopterin oxidoreductase [Occallatibacter riparius]|uniref:TAT-variant-translocated molybdopterin oxidoreductase n=1 Tax=Occallatibacter riparius TaxID=1002689 RepID=A0A9J7BUE3_9BACT|nr:TAT-variant-translocated molybdopterin oxidoreductase [Occallatibacter riparius]UWZ86201.1 TAT-variant-translocated molybdopterin oxidoreductase [Occallatibacter riparius]